MLDFFIFFNLFLADNKVRREKASGAMQSGQIELQIFL